MSTVISSRSKSKRATTRLGAIRIDESIKNMASKVVKSEGFTISSVIREIITKIADTHVLPQEFRPKVPNKVTVAAIKESRSKTTTSFKTIEELMADLNA